MKPFDRRQHGDRRRDHAVAVQQRRPEEAEPYERAAPAAVRGGAAVRDYERQQRQHAALAAIVGAHHDGEVLDTDDDRERPEDERQQAQYGLWVRWTAGVASEALAKSVQRRRADVAVDDPEGPECERRQRARLGGRRDRSRSRGPRRLAVYGRHRSLRLTTLGGAQR